MRSLGDSGLAIPTYLASSTLRSTYAPKRLRVRRDRLSSSNPATLLSSILKCVAHVPSEPTVPKRLQDEDGPCASPRTKLSRGSSERCNRRVQDAPLSGNGRQWNMHSLTSLQGKDTVPATSASEEICSTSGARLRSRIL